MTTLMSFRAIAEIYSNFHPWVLLSRIYSNCHPRKHTHCNPRNLLSRIKYLVIPNLIGDPVFTSFLYFYQFEQVIQSFFLFYLIFKRRNTSWIPAFAGMTRKIVRNVSLPVKINKIYTITEGKLHQVQYVWHHYRHRKFMKFCKLFKI
jgi:hypothetical protein